MTAPLIRPYRPQDRAAAKLVYYRAITEGAAAFYSEAERVAWAGPAEPDWNTPDKLLDQWCYVAEDDGRMTGFMSMEPTGYLEMAFVIPEVMGNGTAAALYDALMVQAKSNGLTRFSVRAAHQSNRFLARRGWQVDQVERFAADGQVYDLFQMSLNMGQIS